MARAGVGIACAPGQRRCQAYDGVARVNLSVSGVELGADGPELSSELRMLFHRLNNQLSIILAHAELLEVKAVDDASRARAAEVVAKVLDAMGTAKEIRHQASSNLA